MPYWLLFCALSLPVDTLAGWDTATFPRLAAEPAALTQDQLVREVAHLRLLLETRIEGLERAMAQLQTLHDEKFRGLDTRLLAARAALSASDDATEKLQTHMHNTMQKQLDQVGALLKHADQNVNERLQGLKERLDRLEGQTSGAAATWGLLLGVVALVGGLVSLLAAVRRQRAPGKE